jgi:A/G-specific adenine glycosylase
MDDARITNFRQEILAWGHCNSKAYPWRRTKDPYKILVSEFMLHRTQVTQALRVYKAFIKKYPSLLVFAQTSQNEVRDTLAPLGLLWRIDGMISSLLFLWEKYQKIPLDYLALTSIEGIGPYIAGATVCFTENRPLPLIDTNTVRVISRVFGLESLGEARRDKNVIKTIEIVCDPTEPRKYYYSIIDLAHNVCHIKSPECEKCPLLKIPCIYSATKFRGVVNHDTKTCN